MSDESGIVEFYNRAKWIIVVFYKLSKQQFTGSIRFDMHEGSVSKKFKREITETAQ